MLYNDGSSISFESLYRANEWSKLRTELEELNFRDEKAKFDRSALVERGNVKEQNAGAFGQHSLQFQPMQPWPQPFEPIAKMVK